MGLVPPPPRNVSTSEDTGSVPPPPWIAPTPQDTGWVDPSAINPSSYMETDKPRLIKIWIFLYVMFLWVVL